jgi:hypothetical protein
MDYASTPGFQFALDTGLDSVKRKMAASGMLHSGGTLQELLKYGTGLAMQGYDKYADRLQQQRQGDQQYGLGMYRAGNDYDLGKGGLPTRRRASGTTTTSARSVMRLPGRIARTATTSTGSTPTPIAATRSRTTTGRAPTRCSTICAWVREGANARRPERPAPAPRNGHEPAGHRVDYGLERWR